MADPDPLAFGVDLDDVRQRFEALNYFLSVTDILEASEALSEIAAALPPAAFVATTREAAQPINVIGGYADHVEVEVTILFVESAARIDRRGNDQLERTRKAVIRQGIGWKPAGAQQVLRYKSYRVVSIDDALAWGEVRFGTSFRLST